MINDINKIDLMDTLKDESKIVTKDKNNKNEKVVLTKCCEMNNKFRNKVFLDYNK